MPLLTRLLHSSIHKLLQHGLGLLPATTTRSRFSGAVQGDTVLVVQWGKIFSVRAIHIEVWGQIQSEQIRIDTMGYYCFVIRRIWV